MEPINWYMKVVTGHYFDFNGRARRAEFWWFILVNIIIGVILNVISSVLHLGTLLNGLYNLAVLLPSLGVGARRLHDGNRSGWWQLIALTGIGVFVLIYWWAIEGTKGQNEHGPDSKGA